jgi:hypothetical protein
LRIFGLLYENRKSIRSFLFSINIEFFSFKNLQFGPGKKSDENLGHGKTILQFEAGKI